MAKTTTTLNGAVVVDQNTITVTSATGFAAGMFITIDQEVMQVASSYVSGTTIPVLRGRDGTATQAHATAANVTVQLGSDFAAAAPQEFVTYPIAGRARTLISYSASGVIAAPLPGNDLVAVLNGTGALAMTLADPTKDMDGTVITFLGNGKAAHTVTPTTPFGNGGAGYAKLTFAAGGLNCYSAIAANGLWVPFPSLLGGTATNVTVTISA